MHTIIDCRVTPALPPTAQHFLRRTATINWLPHSGWHHLLPNPSLPRQTRVFSGRQSTRVDFVVTERAADVLKLVA